MAMSCLDWNGLHIIDFGCDSRPAESSYYDLFLLYLTSAPNLFAKADAFPMQYGCQVCTRDRNCVLAVTKLTFTVKKKESSARGHVTPI